MDTKHTAGKWEYSRMILSPKTKDRRCGFVVNGPDTSEDLPVRICDLRVPRGMGGFAEGEANARLISAAPNLLAVCKAKADAFHKIANDSSYTAGQLRSLLRKWRDELLTACEKAELQEATN